MGTPPLHSTPNIKCKVQKKEYIWKYYTFPDYTLWS